MSTLTTATMCFTGSHDYGMDPRNLADNCITCGRQRSEDSSKHARTTAERVALADAEAHVPHAPSLDAPQAHKAEYDAIMSGKGEEWRRTLQMQQFDTGNANEVRGQFDTWAGVWSWGKNEDGFWAECIEEFDERDGMIDMHVSYPSLSDVLANVRDLHCERWTSASITHDNGKKRSVKF